jgi:Holliday junction resolvase RusA-like endonuclease
MIYLSVPSIPPSSNNAYATIRGTNKRVLTPEGKAYKIETTTHLVRKYPKEMMAFKKNVPYLLLVRFWIDGILNKGYPKTAESRYKKLDTGNRLKLLEDSLKDACALDDSQNVTLVLQKVQPADGNQKTEIWAWTLEAEKSPFDAALLSL